MRRKKIVGVILLGFSLVFLISLASEDGALAARLERAPRVEEAPPRAAAPSPKEEEFVHLDFDDADIRVIIKYMSELTGKNILVDDKVKGRVTIITPGKIPVRDAYKVLESILQVYGFSTVAVGGLIKVVPSAEAVQEGVRTLVGKEPGAIAARDRMISQIIPLSYAQAGELAALLRPLMPTASRIVAYPPANILILTDMASNIQRLVKIIKEADVRPVDTVISVIPLRYASSKELAEQVEEVLREEQEPPTPARPPTRRRPPGAPALVEKPKPLLRALPDERTNSIVLLATKEDTLRAKALIEKLDVPSPPGIEKVHVYYLENAVAEELAKVLTAQLAKAAETKKPEAAAAAAPQAPPPLKEVSITPDKATNSLIITASPDDYAGLREVIKKLDIMRSQVLVEALIAEVSLDKAREIGFEWRVLNLPKEDTFRAVGGTNLPIGAVTQGVINTFAAAPFAGPSGLVLGATRGTITFGGQTFFDLRALIRAFQADSDINILSTPHILTTDNEEAEIFIGENRPFTRGEQTTAEGTIVRTFEFKDIGIRLKLTPHISKNRFVRLKLFQEVLSFVTEPEIGAVVTTKRSADTSVIVQDSQTVVIGGLIRDDKTRATTGVPGLASLPLLGYLFKSQRKTSVKTNLLIFITPHVVKSAEELRRLTLLKREEGARGLEFLGALRKERM